MKYCPVCKNSIESFLPAGVLERNDVKCPICRSRERYRLLTLFLENETNFFTKGGSVLEIGPAKGFSARCKQYKNIKYVSVDLSSELADKKMDITHLEFDDNSFDYIICYHVLEHIKDDKKAIREMVRVLKSEGMCLIAGPVDINRNKTYENDSKELTDNERESIFGQHDHVRIYGKDFVKRLEKGGFSVEVLNYVNRFTPEEREKYGLKDNYNLLLFETNDDIYVCRKK